MTTWTTETLFNRERFEAWLANQPGERKFDFLSTTDCACASFVKEATDAPFFECGGATVDLEPMPTRVSMPDWLTQTLDGVIANSCVIFTIAQLRTTYHKLFNIDVMEIHAPITLTPQPERV